MAIFFLQFLSMDVNQRLLFRSFSCNLCGFLTPTLVSLLILVNWDERNVYLDCSWLVTDLDESMSMGMGFASLFVDIKDVPNFELRTLDLEPIFTFHGHKRCRSSLFMDTKDVPNFELWTLNLEPRTYFTQKMCRPLNFEHFSWAQNMCKNA